MKSLYEHNWTKAVEGAKVNPSEALWENISSALDKEQGRNYWVTLLMIAATVSIAFSFPLTIGDSASKVRLYEKPAVAEQVNEEKDNQGVTEKINEPFKLKESPVNTTISNQYPSSIIIIENKNNNSSIIAATPFNISLAEPKKTGFKMINSGSVYKLSHINSYYFIPYFMPIKKEENRGLFASINMGTGNSSNGNGLINSSVESANELSFADVNNTSKSNIEKHESKSTAFYLGTGVELAIGKKWALLAGIGYLSNKAEGTNNVVSDSDKGYKPLGIYDPLEIGSVFLNESYQYSVSNNYLSVPISVKYPLINRKIKLRAGAGIGTDFMLSHTVNSETYGKASYKADAIGYKPIVLSALINMEVNYSINRHYSIALETGIRRGITPIDTSNKFYPSSFTIGVVLFYKIR